MTLEELSRFCIENRIQKFKVEIVDGLYRCAVTQDDGTFFFTTDKTFVGAVGQSIYMVRRSSES